MNERSEKNHPSEAAATLVFSPHGETRVILLLFQEKEDNGLT